MTCFTVLHQGNTGPVKLALAALAFVLSALTGVWFPLCFPHLAVITLFFMIGCYYFTVI